jgi:hypothetical protein
MKMGKALFCFVVIIVITGCAQSRKKALVKKELILNTLRENHQEIIKTFPEGWDKSLVMGKFQLHNEQVYVGDYPGKACYMVGIIFSSESGQQQILCYTIGENNTGLFLPNDDRKLAIVNALLSKEGTPRMFKQYAEAVGFESFEMALSP